MRFPYSPPKHNEYKLSFGRYGKVFSFSVYSTVDDVAAAIDSVCEKCRHDYPSDNWVFSDSIVYQFDCDGVILCGQLVSDVIPKQWQVFPGEMYSDCYSGGISWTEEVADK